MCTVACSQVPQPTCFMAVGEPDYVACCSGQTSETVVGRVEIPETMSNKQQKPGRHFYFEIWFHKSTTTLLELWEKNDFIPFGISQITSQSFYPSILLIHNFWNNEQHKGLCPDVIPAQSQTD